jgi:hypothetical protein
MFCLYSFLFFYKLLSLSCNIYSNFLLPDVFVSGLSKTCLPVSLRKHNGHLSLTFFKFLSVFEVLPSTTPYQFGPPQYNILLTHGFLLPLQFIIAVQPNTFLFDIPATIFYLLTSLHLYFISLLISPKVQSRSFCHRNARPVLSHLLFDLPGPAFFSHITCLPFRQYVQFTGRVSSGAPLNPRLDL